MNCLLKSGTSNFVTRFVSFRKQIFAGHQLSNHSGHQAKPQLKAFLPRQFRTRFGDYVLREANVADKTAVLNIRKEIHGGSDCLPDFYDHLVSIPNGKAFLVENEGKVISFLSTVFIDEGESCHVKGLRICKKHEKRRLLPTILDTVSDWAKINGAFRIVGAFTDPSLRILRSLKQIATVFHSIHLMQLENVCLLLSDINYSNEVLPLSFSQLSTYIRNEEIRKYLFTFGRIYVDNIIYRLVESNVYLMEEISGHHTVVFSDLYFGDNAAGGLLSFGSLWRGQKVNYVYGIEIYGSDVNSIRKHIARHISYLKQRANGSVHVSIFSFDILSKKLTREICQQFGMECVNYPGTPYPQWNFQTDILVERPIYRS